MTFYLFHQNMRVFGGATPAWNIRMKDAFWSLPIGITGDRVLVAGFTETKNFITAPNALAGMVTALDKGLTNMVTIAVGNTATLMGGSKKRKSKGTKAYYPTEYISIVTKPVVGGYGFNVLRAGKAIYMEQRGLTQPEACFPTTGVGSLAPEVMPEYPKLDSRGLAYVVGEIKWTGDPLDGRILVVCFMHNMYALGDPGGALQKMPRLVKTIYAKHPDIIQPNVNPCIVGADFNLIPSIVKDRAARNFVPAAERAPGLGGKYYMTTDSHVYDWWSCRVSSLTGSKPEIWTETLERLKPDTLSDHTAISLGLHQNLWW